MFIVIENSALLINFRIKYLSNKHLYLSKQKCYKKKILISFEKVTL